jgi:hypothetical protein
MNTHEQDITNICSLASGLLASGHYTMTSKEAKDSAVNDALRVYQDIRDRWQALENQKLKLKNR